MKILCLIDSLGSGGAQRQLCALAVGLKKRGHEVRFLTYHRDDHFQPLLEVAEIPCQVIPPSGYVNRTLAICRILREGWQDVVLAFLEGPSFYAELAGIPGRKWGLVVGERLADPGMKRGKGAWLRKFHRLADAVVCNSHTNRLMLEARFPFLQQKLATIYNTVDLHLFRPRPVDRNSKESRTFRIVVAASYHEKKNMMNVAKALLKVRERLDLASVVVEWFGAVQNDSAPFKSVERFVAENDLGDMMRLNLATRDIASEYIRADAIGLFSFFEGLPNVVCEGLACGKPILLSNVCDAGNLVDDGSNGFLCDPESPDDIADKILQLVALGEEERLAMGVKSRNKAEKILHEDIVIDNYENILSGIAKRKGLPVDSFWPPCVPDSAVRSADRFRGNVD